MTKRSNAFPKKPLQRINAKKVVKCRLMQIPKDSAPGRTAGRSGRRKEVCS
jgi:hypothetical protein